jgi:hypothetical protein
VIAQDSRATFEQSVPRHRLAEDTDSVGKQQRHNTQWQSQVQGLLWDHIRVAQDKKQRDKRRVQSIITRIQSKVRDRQGLEAIMMLQRQTMQNRYRPHLPVCRIGEAKHPGPLVKIPGDGNCLYHALGWWGQLEAAAVRRQLSGMSWNAFREVVPETVEGYHTYIVETRTEGEWGGERQIACFAYLHCACIIVHTPFGIQRYGQGRPWHLVYSTHPGHYDVWDARGDRPYSILPNGPTHHPAPIEVTKSSGLTIK